MFDSGETVSAETTLRATVAADRERVARGERPLYHVNWAPAAGGAVDVTVQELPIVHLFVPNEDGALDGARVLIARTLAVDADSFDLVSGAA